MRKWKEGEYAKKTWSHFDEVTEHLQEIHQARSIEMRDMLVLKFGAKWDSWGTQMNKFWNSYTVDGWDVWSLCCFPHRLCTPSNQCHESWHNQLLKSRIPGMFKGSTEFVFEHALPQLIEMDALLIPSTLCYEVPAVPKGMFEKALWYVDHQKTHVKLTRDVLGEPALYFLVKDNDGEFKSLTAKHVEMYEEALQGVEDRRIVDEDHLRDVCSSLHYVSAYTDLYGLCECYANPGRWVCDCKGNKNYGICSHVLATNHILKGFNIRYELAEIGKSTIGSKVKGGGNRQRSEPALERMKARPADSSDEEEERIVEQGRQGK